MVTRGDRARRAPTYDEATECGRMAAAFNTMLDELDESEQRLRQFMSDVSHELRTPLTSVRGFLDIFACRGFTTVDEQAEAHRRMEREVTRMQALSKTSCCSPGSTPSTPIGRRTSTSERS